MSAIGCLWQIIRLIWDFVDQSWQIASISWLGVQSTDAAQMATIGESDDTRATPDSARTVTIDLHVICLNADVPLITEKHVYIPWYITVHWHQKYKTKETILWIGGMFKVFQENVKKNADVLFFSLISFLVILQENLINNYYYYYYYYYYRETFLHCLIYYCTLAPKM